MGLSLNTLGPFAVLGLIGVGFCLVHFLNRQRLWWAIIPGLGAFTLCAAIVSELLIGADPRNDWINVLVIGVGAAVIGAVLKRAGAKLVLMIVAMEIFVVGIAMAPLTIVLKGVLIAAVLLLSAFYVWRRRRTLPRPR